MRSVSYTANNQIDLLHCGGEFFPALIEAIDGARREIYLETYIFALDETGNAVMQALARAARRGIVVRVVNDWLGTGHRESLQLRAAFREAGVEHKIYNAWFLRGVSRMHRKICIVDESIAFLGGLNINHDMVSDDGFNEPLPFPRWDFAIRIRGPLVQRIHAEVHSQWLMLTGVNLRHRWEKLRAQPLPRFGPQDSPVLAALLVRDNLRNRRAIQRVFLRALGNARKSALLANPYFAPNRKLRDGLAAAAARGVEVTLLLGVGQFRLQDAVAHSFYPKLLKSGVKVVEYRKTQLHGKVAVIDDEWSTVGSSNWDGLSLFVNQEANVVIRNQAFSLALRQHIEHAVSEGVVIRTEDYASIPRLQRALYGLAYYFYRMVLRVITLGRYTE